MCQVHLISGIEGRLPFSLDDASRPESEFETGDVQFNRVLLDTRLNHRVIDLRVSMRHAETHLSYANDICRLKPIKPFSNFREP